MSALQIFITLITASLSGGIFAFLLGIYQSRKQQPAVTAEIERISRESDNLAVATLREALNVAQMRIKNLEEQSTLKDRQLLDRDRRIMDLEQRIQSLQNQVSGMKTSLTAMEIELETLRRLAGPSEENGSK